jgi:hypothetical protein
VFVDNDNTIYAVGRFKTTVDFDPDAPVYNLSTAFNYPEAYVMKYGPLESAVQESTPTTTSLSVIESSA